METYLSKYQILVEEAAEYINQFFIKNPKVVIDDFDGTTLESEPNIVIEIIHKDGVQVSNFYDDSDTIRKFKQLDSIDIIYIATCIQENYDNKTTI